MKKLIKLFKNDVPSSTAKWEGGGLQLSEFGL